MLWPEGVWASSVGDGAVTDHHPSSPKLSAAHPPDKPQRDVASFLALSPEGPLLGIDPGAKRIGIAASAHLGFATACCPFIEYLPARLSESVLRDELVADELEMIDGEIPLPQKPGLGIELNRDALRRYRVD